MTTEAVHSQTAGAGLFLPADGLSLLGEDPGSAHAGRRFLVGRGDGQVIQLPLLLYLIMAAIAEGGLDGGWSADQVSARVRAASGQRLTVDNVRYLIAGKLAPLGLIAADGAEPGPRPAQVKPRPGPKTGSEPPRHRPVALVRRARSRPVPGSAEPLLRHLRRRWALASGGIAVLLSVAAAAPIMAGTGSRGTGGTGPTAAAAAAASRSQAAAWVAQQVSPSVTVACDPGLRAQLLRDGFPAARLKPLPGSARVLPGSGVIVVTPVIRSQFGLRLSSAYAPQVIASFGAGAARVEVRVIAPADNSAFRTQLAAERTAMVSAGRQLLSNQNIQAPASAQAEVRAGQVDARLLTILALLAAQMPVRLAGFTGAPGAGPGVLLRGAEIGVTSATTRSAVVALLDGQQSPYRPTVAAPADGSRSVIALWFDAPAFLDIAQP